MLHGSGSTWFQTSCYGRADLNYKLYLNLADFFENQPKEICSNLIGKALKGVFLKGDVTRDDLQQRFLGKKKNNCCTPTFYNSYFGEVETSFHTQV